MNLLLLFEADRRGGRFVVSGARARHLSQILNAEKGSHLRVGLLDGPLGTATVTKINEEEAELSVAFEGPARLRPTTDLVLAIPRPKLLKKLLPQIASLGIDRLVLIRSWRVQKPYLSTDILSPKKYRPLLHEGLMQGCLTHEPKVIVEPLFKPFIEDRAAKMFEGSLRLLAHPKTDRRLSSIEIRREQRMVIAVGPEGGFVPYEVEAFGAAGFEAVNIGERILRVDTAVVALLAQTQLLREIAVTASNP